MKKRKKETKKRRKGGGRKPLPPRDVKQNRSIGISDNNIEIIRKAFGGAQEFVDYYLDWFKRTRDIE